MMGYAEPTMWENIVIELVWNLPIVFALIGLAVAGSVKLSRGGNAGIPAVICAGLGLIWLALRVVLLFVLNQPLISDRPVPILAEVFSYDDLLFQAVFCLALLAGVISLAVDLD